MNGYNLLRNWYNFKFENPDKTKPMHSDLFCFIVDKWNRLGQKEKFGLPTFDTLELLNVSYNTYKIYLKDLVDFGFIKIVKDSKNQYQSKIIALSKIDKALDKALDKATIKALDEAPNKAVDESLDYIYKQLNNITIKQINNQPKVFCDFVNNNLDLIFIDKENQKKIENEFLKNLCNYFSQTNENLERKVWSFLNHLNNQNKYSEFKKQFLAYKEYKKISEEKIHSWLGYQAEWESSDWVNKLSKVSQKKSKVRNIVIN